MKIGTCKFKQWNCDVILTKYSSIDRKALQLVDSNDGELIAVATVNLPDNEIDHDDETFIKDYSENEGMLECLMSTGIISEPIGVVKTGFVTVFKVMIMHTELKT